MRAFTEPIHLAKTEAPGQTAVSHTTGGQGSLVTTLCVVTIFGRSASFPFLMLFLLSDNFGRRAAEERSHAEHGNEDNALITNDLRGLVGMVFPI